MAKFLELAIKNYPTTTHVNLDNVNVIKLGHNSAIFHFDGKDSTVAINNLDPDDIQAIRRVLRFLDGLKP